MNLRWPAPASNPPLSRGEAHVWAVPFDNLDTQTPLVAALSPSERQTANTFRLEAPRRRFMLARAALRTLLGRYLQQPPHEVAISVDANNKPRLASSRGAADIRFNVTHSADLALIAVTPGCDIGVDLELLRGVRHGEQIAERYFHPSEIETIRSALPDERDRVFLTCWTLKEAVLKAVGVGITGSLASFQVPIGRAGGHEDERPTPVDVPASARRESLHCWVQQIDPAEALYVAAVATVGQQRRIRCLTFTP